MHRYFLALSIALAAAPAWSQYRCPGQDGKVSFQEQPCAGGQKLDLPKPPPDDGRAHVRAAMARGVLTTGMTRAEVVRTWGQPASTNRSWVAGGWSEQMVYRGPAWAAYIYLRDGVVDSFTETNPKP